MKLCPNGHQVDDDLRFCPQCGQEIIEYLNFCPKCGQKRSGSERFCMSCGTLLEKNHTAITQTEEPINNKPKKKKKVFPILLTTLVVLLLGAGCAGVYYWKFMKKDYSLQNLAKVVCEYDEMGDFHDGRAWFRKGDKYGFVDKMGNEIVPAKYDEVVDFKEERACVSLRYQEGNKKCGYIDLTGKEIVPVKYDVPFAEGPRLLSYSEGMAIVNKKKNNEDYFGFIDLDGKEVIPCKYGVWPDDFHYGIALVDDNKYIDKTGKELTRDELLKQKRLVTCWKGEKMGFANLAGQTVIPCQYDIAQEFVEGMAAVCKDQKWGYIDSLGNEVIPIKYYSQERYDGLTCDDWNELGAPDEANNFHEGLVMVMKDGKAGYFNKEGKTVIDFQYDRAADFSEDFAAVKKNDKWGFIDKEGKSTIECKYDSVCSFKEGVATVMLGNKWGCIDKSGKEIVPLGYDNIRNFSEGLAIAVKGGIICVIDKDGKSTLDYTSEEVKLRLEQKKIKEEREQMQREAEERERQRIYEEENKPENRFKKIMESGESVWKCDDYNIVIFLEPTSSGGGSISYLCCSSDMTRCLLDTSSRGSFAVQGASITANTHGVGLTVFRTQLYFTISNEYGDLNIIQQGERQHVFHQIDKPFDDPLNR